MAEFYDRRDDVGAANDDGGGVRLLSDGGARK